MKQAAKNSQLIKMGGVEMNKLANLEVAGVVVRKVEELYCLNDLHKAAGGESKHQPALFLENQQTQRLIEVLKGRKSYLLEPVKTTKGRNGGTYACKALLLSYAAWISPAIFIELSNKIEGIDEIIKALDSFEVPDDMPDMFVYVIREAESGCIKIGISKHPQKRLQQLQIGNSQRLELVAVKRADNRYKDEKAAHLANLEHRIHSEWFGKDAKGLDTPLIAA